MKRKKKPKRPAAKRQPAKKGRARQEHANPAHKRDFDQLLEDAIFGAKK